MSHHSQLVIFLQASLKEKDREETKGGAQTPQWWEMMTFKMQMEVSSGIRVPFIICYPDVYTRFWSNLNSCVPDNLGWHMGEGDTFTTRVDCSIHQTSQA